jgi:hypothetical protein
MKDFFKTHKLEPQWISLIESKIYEYNDHINSIPYVFNGYQIVDLKINLRVDDWLVLDLIVNYDGTNHEIVNVFKEAEWENQFEYLPIHPDFERFMDELHVDIEILFDQIEKQLVPERFYT